MNTPVQTVPVKRGDSVALILRTVEEHEQELMALAPRGYEAQMYYAALRLYFAANPAVLNCKPVSVLKAMLRVAQTGLELGVTCDILPFGDQAQFSARAKGLAELAYSAGTRSLNYGVVREGDTLWDWCLGSEGYVHHKPARGNTGPISHFWAVARLGVTGQVIRVMDAEEVEARKRQYSKQWKTTALEEIPWYGVKTVVREVLGYVPKNARLAAALRYDVVDDSEQPPPDEAPPPPAEAATGAEAEVPF